MDLDLVSRSGVQPEIQAEMIRRFATSKEQLRLKLFVGLFVLDLLSILAGFLIAGAVRTGSPLHNDSLRMVAVMVPTFMGVAINNRAYSLGVLQRPGTGLVKVAEALLYAVAAVIALLFYLKVSTEFSRLIFAIGTVISFVLLMTGRTLVGNWVGRRYNWTFSNRLLLVDGVNVNPEPGDVVMMVDEAGLEPRDGDPIMLDRLSRLLEHCDRVVLACAPERRHLWAQLLKGTAIDVEMLMPDLSALGGLEMRSFNGESTLVVSYGPLGLRDRILKRALDVTIAGSALAVFGPLMLMIAVAIKLDSPGPVLFGQQAGVDVHRRLAHERLHALLVGEPGAERLALGDVGRGDLQGPLRHPQPAHAVREPRGAQANLRHLEAVADFEQAVLVRNLQPLEDQLAVAAMLLGPHDRNAPRDAPARLVGKRLSTDRTPASECSATGTAFTPERARRCARVPRDPYHQTHRADPSRRREPRSARHPERRPERRSPISTGHRTRCDRGRPEHRGR